MKLLFTSDLHGDILAYTQFMKELNKSKYSAGVLGGDLTMQFSSETFRDIMGDAYDPDTLYSDEEEKDMIRTGLKEREHTIKSVLKSDKPIFFIMGNDDGIVGGGTNWNTDGNLISINQTKIMFGPYNFVGYQYSNPYIGGIYEKPEVLQEQDLKELSSLIDAQTILITHSPPFGILDSNLGSKPLRQMRDTTNPKLHLFGHIHESFGILGKSINGSYAGNNKFIEVDLASNSCSLIFTEQSRKVKRERK